MVRPRVKEAKHQFTAMLKPSVVEEIDKYAEKIGLSRSQMISNILDIGLDEIRAMDKWGLLRVGVFTRDIVDKIRDKIYSGKISIDDDGEVIVNK